MMPNVIKESSRGFDRVSIEDELFLSRKIFLSQQIDADLMDALIKQILFLHLSDPKKEITLYINSPGGEVQSGLAAYDLLRLIEVPLITVCIGQASSMAAILFLAGKERIMLKNSMLMIHDPAPAGGDLKGMKPGELEEKLNDLKRTRDALCSIIAERSGESLERIMEKTLRDTYFSAEESLAFGLATQIAERI